MSEPISARAPTWHDVAESGAWGEVHRSLRTVLGFSMSLVLSLPPLVSSALIALKVAKRRLVTLLAVTSRIAPAGKRTR